MMLLNCGVGEDSWRIPWTARRSNQSIIKEIGPECSLEGQMLKLKLQYFGHLMRRTNSLEKTLVVERLKVGGEGDDRGWDGWMASLTQWTWVWANSGSWWWTGRPGMLQSMGSQRVRQDWETELTDLLSLNSSHTFSFSYFPYSVSERLCKWPGTKLALTAPCSFHCFKTVSQLLGFNLVSPYLLRPHKFFDI